VNAGLREMQLVGREPRALRKHSAYIDSLRAVRFGIAVMKRIRDSRSLRLLFA